jgi:hypothetical protein
MSGWAEVDRPRRSGMFLQLDDGETKRIRVLDQEPWTTHVHRISQNINGSEVFLSVQETARPDEDLINEMTNRYPAAPQHHIRVLVYDDDGEPEGIKVLSGGIKIFKPMKGFVERYGDIRDFDLEITRDGTKRETDYSVTIAPNSHEVDVAEWWEQAEAEIDMERLLQPPTREQQQQLIDTAGIDLTYDPAAEIMAEMTLDEALNKRMPFGKKYGPDAYPPSGKKIGEILAIDAGFIQWAANNITSDDEVAAACRVAIAHMDELDTGRKRATLPPGRAGTAGPARTGPATRTAKGKATESAGEVSDEVAAPEWTLKMTPQEYLEKFPKGPKAALARQVIGGEEEPVAPTKTAKKAPAKAPAKKATEAGTGQTDLVAQVIKAFDANGKYKDPTEIVECIKRHGGGKTRLKDLTAAQLQALLAEISA